MYSILIMGWKRITHCTFKSWYIVVNTAEEFLHFYVFIIFYIFIPILWLILYQIIQNILKILYISFSSSFK
jgi:hypothetical protein